MKKKFNRQEYRHWKSKQISQYKEGFINGLLIGLSILFIIATVIIAGYLIKTT
jgi:hypothetical protein